MNNRHGLTLSMDWLQAGWPLTLTLVTGATWFAQPILHSIAATPHPALVYLIFGALTVGVALAWGALYQVQHEERRARKLATLTPQAYGAHVRLGAKRSPFQDAYQWLLEIPPSGTSPDHQRRELERRLHAGERVFVEHLSLPGFIAGGLVGLGLVGTFIGLLGALDDLARLFSGLNGSAGADPSAMFSGMLSQLQSPMRSMGTAFIASLYGLLGSLLLGMTLVAVNKSRLRAVASVHDALLDALDKTLGQRPSLQRLPHESEAEHQRWQTLLTALSTLHEDQMRREAAAGDSADMLVLMKRMAASLDGLAQHHARLQPQVWLEVWTQMGEQLSELRAHQETSARVSLAAMQGQHQATQRLVELAGQSHESALARRHEELGRDEALQQSLQDCRLAFEQTSGRLRGLLSLHAQAGEVPPAGADLSIKPTTPR